ncbi:MAG: ABC transporter permease [Deltaproteobacteria bacterium]|nr:ABC transporter permease [Deltaproteobacteria bacterium]
MSWVRVRELVRKELIQLFRDKKNRPLLVIAPFVQLLIFGYVVTTDVRDVRVGVLDYSHSIESRRLLDALDANKTFRITRHVGDSEALEEILLKRQVDIALKIPPDFSRRIREKDSAEIQVLVDGTMSNMALVRIAYTVQILNTLNQQFIQELYARKLEYGKVDTRLRTWYNPNLESRNFYVPAIVAVLVMILSLLLTSMAIIREKEKGTIEQLIVTPLGRGEFVLGKTVPYVIIALGQMVMVTVFAVFWFSIPFRGNIALIFLGTCLFLLSTLGIGLFISTISSTQQQAMMTTFFFLMPFFMFSGFVFPIANMPVLVRWIAYVNPLMYFLVIVRGVFLKGVGLGVLWPQFLAMTVIGVAVFCGALNRFRKTLD